MTDGNIQIKYWRNIAAIPDFFHVIEFRVEHFSCLKTLIESTLLLAQ